MATKIVKQNNNFRFQKKLLAVVCSLTVSGIAIAQDVKKEELIDEVVITGRQQALANADERKKKAESSIDSIVADDAGKLPDASIAEVLQRVSGVTLVRFGSLGDPDHFSGEGSGIQVRGLSGVASRLNGHEVFSSNSGHGISWSDVTPEMMAAVDVYKSSTADLIEGGTGGQVDLRTKMPFDYGSEGIHGGATLSANYGDMANNVSPDGGLSPSGSVLVSDRWSTEELGEFGVLVDIAKAKNTWGENFIRMEPYYKTRLSDGTDKFIPGGYNFGEDWTKRDREGAYVAMQWAPSETLSFSQTAFYSRYDSSTGSHGQFVNSKEYAVDPVNSKFDSNGALISSDKIFLRNTTDWSSREGETLGTGSDVGLGSSTSKTLDLTTSFDWKATDKIEVKGSIQSVHSTGETNGYSVGVSVPFAGFYGLDLTGEYPKVTIPESQAALQQDLTKYKWNNTMDVWGDSEGSMLATNVDVNYVISEEDFFRSAQVGARYADRTEKDHNASYNWQGIDRKWWGDEPTRADALTLAQGVAAGNSASDFEQHTYNNFFRGDVNLPANPYLASVAMVARHDQVGDHTKYGAGIQNPTRNPQQLANQTETNTSLYGLVRFAGENYSGNVGARYVTVESSSDGFVHLNAAHFTADNAVTEVTVNPSDIFRAGDNSFSKVLPNISLKYDASETVNMRFGYNKTMDLPSFYLTRASGNISALSAGKVQSTLHPWELDANGAQKLDTNGKPIPVNIDIYGGLSGTAGNPVLKPVLSNNADLSVEWYPNRTSALHASLFHKSINNWFTYSNDISMPMTMTGSVESITATQDFSITAPIKQTIDANSDGTAKVMGVEFGGHTYFTMLPSPWDGFGVDANYTYIDSSNPGDRYLDINGIEHSDAPIQGLSKNSFNFTLMFDKGPISLRAAYNWRSTYLMGTHGNGTDGDYKYFPAAGQEVYTDISLPNYAKSAGYLDIGGDYKVTDDLTVSLQAKNVTNTITKTLMGGYENNSKLTRSWFTADRTIEVVVRYNF